MLSPYLGEAGLTLAVLANVTLGGLLAYGAPWPLLAVVTGLAVVGVGLGARGLVIDSVDQCRHWERVAQRAEGRARACLQRGEHQLAHRYLYSARMAREMAGQARLLQGRRGGGR